MPSLYLINPASDFPTYFSAENYAGRGLRPATQMADLAIPTLAAMAPSDFSVRLCDQNVTAVDYDDDSDYIGITGKITQRGHMIAIATEFRRRGKKVLIGGPYASLSPDVLRPHCDILVKGEIEEIFEEIFSDLRNGNAKTEYVGSQPDLSTSPVPRWDLYPNDRAVMGTVQTSRGCPFECEFCDVIQYAGRKQRHKGVEQVIRELDVLYAHGYREIFLADDNFTVFRSRARELLVGLRAWNERQDKGKVGFVTQVSIDAAKDDELLTMCSEAGLTTVFIGIETPNADSLKQAKKRQNLRVNLSDQVHNFFAHGICVVGGMIVGFDADGPDIFQRQFDFAMLSGIPIFSVGALVAPAATPLYSRMKDEGRLRDNGSETAAVPWSTNIVHPSMSEQEIVGGLKWLTNNLYSPASFGDRLITLIDALGKRRDPKCGERLRPETMRSVDLDSMDILAKLRQLGPDESAMYARVLRATMKKPEATPFVLSSLIEYMQIRYMYDSGNFWEPQLTTVTPEREAAPPQKLIALRRQGAQPAQ
jgi:radical SAM superfamily enzyme YgiQ (UPF0313 family)